MEGEPWRVCIRDLSSESVLGAGMLLCTGQVLTCAHAIIDRKSGRPYPMVVVEFCDRRGASPARGSVVSGAWLPPHAGRGDVVLLDLDRAQPDGCWAQLRRISATPGRTVRMYGFPDANATDGLWRSAAVMGHGGPQGEWVRLSGTPDQNVEEGFRGAGVVDDATGSVIGMLVAAHTDRSRAVSWMLPVDAIVRSVPHIGRCVRGGSAVDPALAGTFEPEAPDGDLARKLTNWLGRHETGGVLIIVIAGSNSEQAATLRRAIVAAASELRPVAADRAPADTVPPAGSLDLAIDASGMTADEVSMRILDRIGFPSNESKEASERVRDDAPPMSVVVDAVDDADDPESLVTRVLAPLAERAVERDIRLLIGFRRASSPSLGLLVARRLDHLETLVARVASAEEAARRRHQDVAPRIANAPEVPTGSIALRLGLTALGTETDSQRRLEGLGRLERAAGRALSRARAVQRRLDELLAERGELRGRLEGYQRMAAGLGLVEDTELGSLHQQAFELLSAGGCDLDVAAGLVDRYVRAVRVRSAQERP